MAIISRLTEQEIKERFTYVARFAWLCPVYFNEDTNELQEMNWIPEVVFWLTHGIWSLFSLALELVDDDYEPGFPIQLIRRI